MKRCSRCGGRLFIEHTEDGVERLCINGHRFAGVPLKPIPTDEVKEIRRKPSVGGMQL